MSRDVIADCIETMHDVRNELGIVCQEHPLLTEPFLESFSFPCLRVTWPMLLSPLAAVIRQILAC